MRQWSRLREIYALALRREAATPVLARIGRHRLEAPGSFQRLFDVLERHIFDCGFNVEALCRLSDENPTNFSGRFTLVVGVTPRAYIASGRLETAWGLLASDLKHWEIAEVLGYRSVQVFTDAFARCYGLRPKECRAQLGYLLRSGLVRHGESVRRSKPRATSHLPLASSKDFPSKLQLWRRFLGGKRTETQCRGRRACTWSGLDVREHPSGG